MMTAGRVFQPITAPAKEVVAGDYIELGGVKAEVQGFSIERRVYYPYKDGEPAKDLDEFNFTFILHHVEQGFVVTSTVMVAGGASLRIYRETEK